MRAEENPEVWADVAQRWVAGEDIAPIAKSKGISFIAACKIIDAFKEQKPARPPRVPDPRAFRSSHGQEITPELRAELIDRYTKGEPVTNICRGAAVSWSVLYPILDEAGVPRRGQQIAKNGESATAGE